MFLTQNSSLLWSCTGKSPTREGQEALACLELGREASSRVKIWEEKYNEEKRECCELLAALACA